MNLGENEDLIVMDFWRMLVGECLGEGLSRATYVYKLDPTKVIKIEAADDIFQNVSEYQIWSSVSHTRWAKWFAPIHFISPMGRVLIMDRTMPIGREHIPKQVPSFMSDIHLANLGYLDGRVVCHDYGFHLLAERGLDGAKMISSRGLVWNSEAT